MVRRKVDNRIRTLIENGVAVGHRTMFVIVGDRGRDQTVILHHMLAKSTVKTRPTILWCYKKELGFSSHRKKRMKSLQQKIKSGKLNVNEDDPFELFVASTNIRYCYYSESHKILGQTFGMLILQDFEALTPNLLARTIETVEGGGLIVILLRSLDSLKQLYTMSMDIHERYRTEVFTDVVGRFNERFLLSLGNCNRSLVLNDQLTVLPISSSTLEVKSVSATDMSENDKQLIELKESLKDTQPGKVLLKFIEAISEKTLSSTVSLTASRGRGKSAALGLAVAAAIAFDYSNIFVTSPSPENLNTFFQFVFKGFDALEYQEHLDYDMIQSVNPDFNKAIIRVNIFRAHRQTIQYIHPSDGHKLSHAELVVIDEAAAIPLPLVKSMLGPYLVFVSSTINGYEGTGRSLSLKLLQQIRSQAGGNSKIGSHTGTSKNQTSGRVLYELTLEESIRYRPGDVIERWLSDLLCLDATSVQPILSGYPTPDDCDLYYINRDTLFCYHTASEAFLQRLVALYVASHYKNTPNDLQMMSDAPAHHLFCLLGPIDAGTTSLPEIIVVIQVCLEGRISKRSVNDAVTRGKRAAGDLIPWTIAQQFQDENFPMLSGARIVRIATHPDYQGMGYGSRALNLLEKYYSNKIQCLDEETIKETIEIVQDERLGLLEEQIEPRKSLPPLLMKLSERKAEHLDYIGVSFGLTQELLKFWKRADYVPVYIRQTKNDLTGEHSCILLKSFDENDGDNEYNGKNWLGHFSNDFKRRFVSLLSSAFRHFSSTLGLSVLNRKLSISLSREITKDELDFHMTSYDIKRLEMYSNNLVDYHLIMDLVPTLSRFYFLNVLKGAHFSAVQSTIILGLGLQNKTVDDIATELDLPSSQVLGIFNKIIRKFVECLNSVLEKSIDLKLSKPGSVQMTPTVETVEEDLEKAAKKLKEKQKKELEQLKNENLVQYAIKGTEEDWSKALVTGGKSIISIKIGEKRPSDAEGKEELKKKKRKNKVRR
ncbi:N-acetyltransferase 10 [Polyplax serrata]|uniref:RNA cytidine acetyltransferase n=1 Tax=Polyplax serrata TaxID=468196 RepID=A0AAN8NSI0_POLSC